ncbi:MAG: NUDIX domain-containing protein [Deltaproteobacteria bacterium]|nr:NUDIX domain-containing protein [Deltaproteobacteria bacterium]
MTNQNLVESNDTKKIFDAGLLYHHYANTAYPLTPNSFRDFRITDQTRIESFLKSEWEKTDRLSLYVHIPFCKVRCKFCEYAVLQDTDESTEGQYVDLLLQEMAMYKKILEGKKIAGYDLGGGTPTKLSVMNLKKITSSITESFDIPEDVIFSIETTPVIAAKEPEKILEVYNMGYHRISMGIQTVSEKLLNELGREGATHIYEKAVQNIRKAGYTKFNIDLMYGFLNQDNEDFENTLNYAISLNPDYITLYRNRYKGTKLEKEAGGVSLYKIIQQYRLAYKLLNENGFFANPGKNTFSRIKKDYGTSDYLTERVIKGTSYVGMGLGAQSFGMEYLAYNQGAANKQLEKYRQLIEKGQFPFQDIYSLNKEESIAKMVSVAFYFGFVDIEAFQKRFGLNFLDYFKKEVEFVTSQSFMEIIKNRIYLTDRGSDYINGIIPLFFSKRSKAELMDLIGKSETKSNGEKEFLSTYNIEEFARPSVTTDIIVFSSKKQQTNKLSILMIKRGEHPFMNDWALPGGFIKPGETVEQTAHRELYEEAGVSNIELSQLGMFSQPKRDPRGWVISCAFVGHVEKENTPLNFGEDAIDAQWFELQFKADTTGKYSLILTGEQGVISAEVEKNELTNNTASAFKNIKSKGIAFDHAEIIAIALTTMDLECDEQ